MKSSQIRAILRQHLSSVTFRTVQVCACNELPRTVKDWQKPALFVVNTDPNYRDGCHWVAIVLFQRTHQSLVHTYFFDPLGFPPSQYDKSLTRLLHANSSPVSRAWNCLSIQPVESESCGYYCTYFALTLEKQTMNPFSTVYAMFNLNECNIVSYVLDQYHSHCH